MLTRNWIRAKAKQININILDLESIGWSYVLLLIGFLINKFFSENFKLQIIDCLIKNQACCLNETENIMNIFQNIPVFFCRLELKILLEATLFRYFLCRKKANIMPFLLFVRREYTRKHISLIAFGWERRIDI